MVFCETGTYCDKLKHRTFGTYIIAANRHKLPSAHIYIYKYDKARRLTSISYPNGTTDYYSYDFLDRLREIYDYGESNGQYVKRIKHKYDYGYKK